MADASPGKKQKPQPNDRHDLSDSTVAPTPNRRQHHADHHELSDSTVASSIPANRNRRANAAQYHDLSDSSVATFAGGAAASPRRHSHRPPPRPKHETSNYHELSDSSVSTFVGRPAERGFFFNISEHADGERRGPVPI